MPVNSDYEVEHMVYTDLATLPVPAEVINPLQVRPFSHNAVREGVDTTPFAVSEPSVVKFRNKKLADNSR